MTPEQIACAIFEGAHRTRTDLRSTLDISDSTFDALHALAQSHLFSPGDRVSHPQYGYGTVYHPGPNVTAATFDSGRCAGCYNSDLTLDRKDA